MGLARWPPNDRRKEREGKEGAKIIVPRAPIRDASFHDAGWLRLAVRLPTAPLSVSRRVLGKRELCFRDTDVKRIKAYESQLNERDDDRSVASMSSDLATSDRVC